MRKRYIIALILTVILLRISGCIWLGYHGTYHIDWLLLLIITILGYLLFLKLTSYLAEFKSIKNQSVVDIVFLAIFFISVFIPMSSINQADKSPSENRMLVKWKPLLNDKGELNYNFGKNYESWFNDRFGQRLNLIAVNTILKFAVVNEVMDNASFLYIKKNNWIFAKTHILTKPLFVENNIKNTADTLTKLNAFCKDNHIKLYVLIVPYNSYVYSRELGPYRIYQEKRLKELSNAVKQLQSRTNAKIIYPYDTLVRASYGNQYTFFKTEHHWTEYGAYLGYLELMKEITKDYPDIRVLKENDYNISTSKLVRGDWDRRYTSGRGLNTLAKSLSIFKDKILDTEYKYYDFKDINNIKGGVINESLKEFGNFYYPKGYNLRVLQTGSSMNANLLTFTVPAFRYTMYIKLNTGISIEKRWKLMKYHKQDILDFKPDIMIFCITPQNLGDVSDKLFAEDN